ncbi:UNVERIFIED_ORG: hypothetical protein BDK47_11849 [Anoxybacillus amylolyticus]
MELKEGEVSMKGILGEMESCKRDQKKGMVPDEISLFWR